MAAKDIPEETFVWDEIHSAKFPSPVEFRKFLASLPTPLACDVMLWAYVEEYDYYEEDEDEATTRMAPRLVVVVMVVVMATTLVLLPTPSWVIDP